MRHHSRCTVVEPWAAARVAAPRVVRKAGVARVPCWVGRVEAKARVAAARAAAERATVAVVAVVGTAAVEWARDQVGRAAARAAAESVVGWEAAKAAARAAARAAEREAAARAAAAGVPHWVGAEGEAVAKASGSGTRTPTVARRAEHSPRC